jgi:hypothetical protein
MLNAFPAILTYGAVGLASILAYLTFRLLARESQKKRPNEGMLRATNRFMITSIALAIVSGLLTTLDAVVKAERPSNRSHEGYGAALGNQAHESFVKGGDAEHLDGTWRVTWYMTDENGQRKKFEYQDPETYETKEYAPEIIHVKTSKEHATVSCWAESSRTKNVKYWLEGRISKERTVTLIYWSPADGICESLVGTVYLQYYPNYMQKNGSMKGWWVGYTQDNSSTASAKVTRGESEWEKLD